MPTQPCPEYVAVATAITQTPPSLLRWLAVAWGTQDPPLSGMGVWGRVSRLTRVPLSLQTHGGTAVPAQPGLTLPATPTYIQWVASSSHPY